MHPRDAEVVEKSVGTRKRWVWGDLEVHLSGGVEGEDLYEAVTLYWSLGPTRLGIDPGATELSLILSLAGYLEGRGEGIKADCVRMIPRYPWRRSDDV